MAVIPAKVIARIHATSDGLEELSWEWVLRAGGQVCSGSSRWAGARSATHG